MNNVHKTFIALAAGLVLLLSVVAGFSLFSRGVVRARLPRAAGETLLEEEGVSEQELAWLETNQLLQEQGEEPGVLVDHHVQLSGNSDEEQFLQTLSEELAPQRPVPYAPTPRERMQEQDTRQKGARVLTPPRGVSRTASFSPEKSIKRAVQIATRPEVRAPAETATPQHHVHALLSEGKELTERRDYPGAVRVFNKAIRALPAGDAVFAADAYTRMGEAMYALSQHDNRDGFERTRALETATVYVKEALRLNPRSAAAHYLAACIADAQPDDDQTTALTLLERAAALDRREYRYSYELGKRLFAVRRFAEAQEAFNAATVANPKFEPAFFNLGLTCRVRAKHDLALQAFRAVIRLNPTHTRAWIELGRVHDAQGEVSAALADYQKAQECAAAAEAHDLYLTAARERARVLAKSGAKEEAVRLFQEILERDSEDALTLYNLATVLLDLDRNEEALKHAQQAVYANGSQARFLYAYALAAQKTGRVDLALTQYQLAAARDPAHVKAHNNLGKLYLDKGALQEAETHLQAALAHDAQNFEVNSNLGKLYVLRAQWETAIAHYRRAATAQPQDREAQCQVARVYVAAGQPHEALRAYRAVLAQDARAWDVYLEAGKLAIKVNEKEYAQEVLTQLLDRNPDYAQAPHVRQLLSSL